MNLHAIIGPTLECWKTDLWYNTGSNWECTLGMYVLGMYVLGMYVLGMHVLGMHVLGI